LKKIDNNDWNFQKFSIFAGRNNFLFSNAIYLLPYTGAGSGIQRALEEGVNVGFNNDERTHDFLITLKSAQKNQEKN